MGPLRKKKKEKHTYVPLPPYQDDDEAYQRNLKKLKNEASKKKPSPAVVKELMSRTFRHRQQWIRSCDGELNVAEVFEEYPMLKENNYVSDYLLYWRAKFNFYTPAGGRSPPAGVS